MILMYAKTDIKITLIFLLMFGWKTRSSFTKYKLLKYGFDGNSEMMKICQQELIQMSSWIFRENYIFKLLNILAQGS